MEFEDLEQIIATHIYKKWHLWDQAKPLENWVNSVITNQILNLVRNNYINYAKPCYNCPHNLSCNEALQPQEKGHCDLTSSGLQDSECPEYSHWEKTKQKAFNVRLPVSYEKYGAEIAVQESSDYDYESAFVKIKTEMQNRLSEKHFNIFNMLFFENMNDEEVAAKIGFKTNEKGRKPGYARIATLKKKFRAMMREIVDEM